MNSTLVKTAEVLEHDFDLEVPWHKTFSEAELVILLSHRLEELYRKGSARLSSLLYRLDIDQTKAFATLDDEESNPHMALARLIVSRQKQKVISRMLFPQKPIDWDLE